MGKIMVITPQIAKSLIKSYNKHRVNLHWGTGINLFPNITSILSVKLLSVLSFECFNRLD